MLVRPGRERLAFRWRDELQNAGEDGPGIRETDVPGVDWVRHASPVRAAPARIPRG